jgi:GTPase
MLRQYLKISSPSDAMRVVEGLTLRQNSSGLESISEESKEKGSPVRKFVDFGHYEAKAGNGGNPAPGVTRHRSFRGPGYGGHGGSVIMRASRFVESLSSVTPTLRAEDGTDGGQEPNVNSRGKDGRDLLVEVPLGTIYRERIYAGKRVEDNRRIFKPRFVYQFLKDGDTLEVCKKGTGGVAPSSFKLKDGRAGEPGEKKRIELELRIIADCALLGKTNSGKSSLLASLTNVMTRIGPEPSSTIDPHVGFMGFSDGKQISLVDMPPLLFAGKESKTVLRHMWRSKLLIFVVDLSDQTIDAFEEFTELKKEVESFDMKYFKERKIIVVGTKCDMVHRDTLFKLDSLAARISARFADVKVIGTSSRFGLGIEELAQAIKATIEGKNGEASVEVNNLPQETQTLLA